MKIKYYNQKNEIVELDINRRLIIHIDGIDFRLSERNGRLVVNKNDERVVPDNNDALLIHPTASNEIECL